MLDPLMELLGRQVDAAGVLEARLRVLELLVAAGEQHLMMQALDEVETASETLSGLELTRTLALMSAGYPADTSAAELIASPNAMDGTDDDALRTRIADLRRAMLNLAEALSRTDHVVRATAGATQQRQGASQAPVAV